MDYKARKFNKESFSIYSNAVINGYKTVIDVYKGIEATANKMNGKILNKRFWDALNELLKNKEVKATVWCGDTYNFGYHDMKIYLDDRYVCVNNRTEYFDNELCYAYIHNVENSFLNDDKRINSQKVEDICDSHIESCQRYIEQWEDAAMHFDEYTDALKNAVNEFGEKMKRINPLFTPNEIHSFDWK